MGSCNLRSCGTERAAASYSLGIDGSAKGIDNSSIGTIERSNLNADIPSVLKFREKAIFGQSFLGQRLLCKRRSGYGHDMQACPPPIATQKADGAAFKSIKKPYGGTTYMSRPPEHSPSLG